MVFASMTFLWLFLPVTLGSYYILAKFGKQESKNLLLLFMSLLFYSFGEPVYIALLLLSVTVNYLGGLLIERNMGAKRKAALAAVAVNLALLGYFKYFNFFVDAVNGLAGGEYIAAREIALPVGISFYTFQAMSYIIDLYRGKCTVQRSFWRLLLYITFFPQLIAGPIVRYRDVADQISFRRESFEKFSQGLSRFIAGLGKKVILANSFAQAVDRVFALEAADRGTAAAWFAMILYAMQIYFDFSGYSDMAIGLGKMFGFDFLENFNMPYIAGSVREFWRRWHISLSTWFKEYLYIPLGGSRRGRGRTYINLLIVFFTTGFWHGAGWTFIVWGLMHGLFLVLERGIWGRVLERNPLKPLNHLYTLLVVLIAWVFFRADTMTDAWEYLKAMFFFSPAGNYGFRELFGNEVLVLSAAGFLLGGALPQKYQERLTQAAAYRGIFLPLILLVSTALLAAGSYNPFIYFRF